MSATVAVPDVKILPERIHVWWTPGDGKPDRCTITWGSVPPWQCTREQWRELVAAVDAGFETVPVQMENAAKWNVSKARVGQKQEQTA
jgi:hypothetical protein